MLCQLSIFDLAPWRHKVTQIRDVKDNYSSITFISEGHV